MTSRPSTAAPIVAALAFVLLPLVAYVGAYYGLGDRLDWNNGNAGAGRPEVVERTYQYEWQVALFKPAGWLERRIGRIPVHLRCPDDLPTTPAFP